MPALAVAALAYVAGNLTSRRLVCREPRRLLILLATGLAVADLAFLAADCGITMRTILFSTAAFAAGSRTLISSAYAVSMPAERRAAATTLRASTMQFGYFVGSSVGGAALAEGGYRALGVAMGSLFLAAAVALVRARASLRPAGSLLSRATARAALAYPSNPGGEAPGAPRS